MNPQDGPSSEKPIHTDDSPHIRDEPNAASVYSLKSVSKNEGRDENTTPIPKDGLLDPTGEPPSESLLITEMHSVFTVSQKRVIILTGSFAAFFSPLSSAIYFPALTTIANDLHVSNSKISLTVTTYLIIQGLAPMMIAGFSDRLVLPC